MILTHGWDALEDLWKRRAEKLLDTERIEELILQRQIPRDASPIYAQTCLFPPSTHDISECNARR